MPIYNKDYTTKIDTMPELISEYGRPLRSTNQWGVKGSLSICNDTKISVICDESGKRFLMRFKSLKNQIKDSVLSEHTIVSYGLLAHKSKVKSGGYDEINKKIFKTRLERFGTIGVPFTDERRKKASESKKALHLSYQGVVVRDKIREKALERFKDKTNHPFYGKSHSDESNEKNRASQYAYLEKHGLTSLGSCKFKRGSFFSKKMQTDIRYKSSYEYTMFIYLEFSSDVLQYLVEPFSLDYVFNGRNRKYFPDVLVKYKDRSHLIEIKPNVSKLRDDPRNLAKFNAGHKYSRDTGNSYFILGKGEIGKYIFSNNMSFNKKFMMSLMSHINSDNFGSLVNAAAKG